jgi:peptidyl-prolyl cis-trans isomerase SurA
MIIKINEFYTAYLEKINLLKKRRLLVTLLFFFMFTSLISVSAQFYNTKQQGIVAVVNTDIISQFDFIDRIKLVIFTSQLPSDKKTVKRISPQILRGLITDQLKLQETKKLGIKVGPSELKAAITKIEKMNGLAKGKMRILMKEKGINFRSFERQVEIQAAWQKAVVKNVLSTNKIGDEAVDSAITAIESNKGKPEYNIGEIFVSFETSKSPLETGQIAMRLYSQLEQGANFSALARAFSQSVSAANGGNLGWVRHYQVEKNLSKTMILMKKNTISKPFKGEGGYYILRLFDKRLSSGVPSEKMQITLQQLFLPLPENSTIQKITDVAERAKNIASNTRTCSDLNKKGKELGSKQSGELKVDDVLQLPSNIRNIVSKIELSKASKPIRTSTGILIIMVCNRNGGGIAKNMRAQIKNMLLNKLAILADRRMLRDIKRIAFLDIRQ